MLHVRKAQMLHPLEHGPVDRLGVVDKGPGLRLQVALAADLQEGPGQHLPRRVAEQGAVHIDAADERGLVQAQHVGGGATQGMARGGYAPVKVDPRAPGLPRVPNGVQSVQLPFVDPADDELAIVLLQLVEPLGQLPVSALGVGQLEGLHHAAPKGIILLFGELPIEKEAGAVVQLRAAGVVGMAHGHDHVALGGKLDAQKRVALPIGGQAVVIDHQREPAALDPRRVGVAFGHVVPSRGPLAVADGHMEGFFETLGHVPGHVGGSVHARHGFRLHRVVDPDRDASFGAGGSKLLPVGVYREGGGADGVWTGGCRSLVHMVALDSKQMAPKRHFHFDYFVSPPRPSAAMPSAGPARALRRAR